MLFGIEVNGGFLDFYPDFVISYNLENVVLSSRDNSSLPGSYQFPHTVPLTSNNKKLLRNPQEVHNESELMRDELCRVYAGGTLLFQGLLTVSNADQYSAKIYTIVNPTKSIKNVPLKDFDYGPDITLGANEADARAHAKLTAQNPLDYNYIFFPVYNENINDDAGSSIERNFQNPWHSVNQEFFNDTDDFIVTPFVRVDFVLKTIFESLGFVFDNKLQSSEELKKLIFYNNYDVRQSNGDWPLSINLKNHVPGIQVRELISSLATKFASVLDFNYFTNVITLRPMRDTINSAPKFNWTGKLAKDLSLSNFTEDKIDRFAYKLDGEDDIFKIAENNTLFYEKPDTFVEVNDFPDVPRTFPLTDTFYYLRNRGQYWRYEVPGNFSLAWDENWDELKPEVNKNDLSVFGAPITDVVFNDLLPTYFYGTPTDEWLQVPSVGYPKVSSDNPTIPLRYTIYRGFYNDGNGNPYPMASSRPIDSLGNQIGDISLHWTGTHNLQKSHWNGWLRSLTTGKAVKASLHLHISDLIKFSFQDKVRIGNMNYIVKSLRVSFNRNGLLPVEAELLSEI